uniref:TSA: Wollemia nobilis Ref_Wollemi_Transcript_13586_996 transcribed RNA sequence n=1 Tax=Wollemia nobilis TaxID=56998 RepID=A0A0C9S7G8_9CONI
MAKSLILWLHGRGDTGPNNMFIKNFFSASEFANTKWLFPTAPSQRITCNNGQMMPAWYDAYEIPVTAESPKDEEGIMKSVKKIHEMIDKETATGISHKNIFVCGFSQGGALTLASTMLYPKTLGGAAVFSGSVQFNNKLSFIEKISPEAKQTPILWCHGMSDNIVDFGAGQVAPPLLEQAGVSCQFKAYPGLDHVISTEELTFLEGWIKGRIQSSSL